MDKPQIDLEKLKEIQDKKNKTEPVADEEILGRSGNGWVLTRDGWVKEKPAPSLTDPYYDRRHLISIYDFDEWA